MKKLKFSIKKRLKYCWWLKKLTASCERNTERAGGRDADGGEAVGEEVGNRLGGGDGGPDGEQRLPLQSLEEQLGVLCFKWRVKTGIGRIWHGGMGGFVENPLLASSARAPIGSIRLW